MTEMQKTWDFIVIGGGAAGYFGAIACAEANPNLKILILEATSRVLTKVKISGGGRCNVTHHQFDPKQLVSSYPRGSKELLGPFHQFQPQNTVEWFAKHGVTLKAEADGRMFPTTNNSQTIIDCLQNAAQKSGVILKTNELVQYIKSIETGYEIQTKSNEIFLTKNILLATGSMPFGVRLAQQLGHKIVSPVPSLFTFEINHPLLQDLQGVSFEQVEVALKTENIKKPLKQVGPCLITHWGLSGPAILKLSAFAARELFDAKYNADLKINWVYPNSKNDVLNLLTKLKENSNQKNIEKRNPFKISQRFWLSILNQAQVLHHIKASELSFKKIEVLAELLTASALQVTGKGVFKEEFVTAGGVAREEIDFRTMESKRCKGIFFAGEIIDIDGITGGFNFQNAWTGAWIAGQTVAQNA